MQPHQVGGMVGVAVAPGVGALDGAEVEAFNDVGNVTDQVMLCSQSCTEGRSGIRCLD